MEVEKTAKLFVIQLAKKFSHKGKENLSIGIGSYSISKYKFYKQCLLSTLSPCSYACGNKNWFGDRPIE